MVCNESGCRKNANYNIVGLKAKFCASHKTDSMICVRCKRCAETGCQVTATFNNRGQKMALYCSIHKHDGMVNVINRKCKYEGCDTIPTFNVNGQKGGLYCSIHKHDGMINITHIFALLY